MEENKEQIQQEEVETVSKADYDLLVAERDDLIQYKPKEKSEEELALETKQNELWEKEKSLELKSVNLEQFAGFFNAQNSDDLKSQIESFQSLLAEMKASMGYVPKDHVKADPYTIAEQKKDVGGMLQSKLANLFK
ncbi:hypothetical protein [Rossellomorea marisflavi]|uniref:hypothetical protein n=1 Tax=Rossellomorea marisflavi TaxID=189381 RepID=UPI0009A882FA|nr:hypothetical protein [Rossellomorea marisflavi]